MVVAIAVLVLIALAMVCLAGRLYLAQTRWNSFERGKIMGRAAAQVEQESLDRWTRDAGIDPSTLPDRP